MVNPLPSAPAPSPEGYDIREMSAPIFQARGWLKFLGVLSIISGIFQALSIVGLLFAWLPIWMGILLHKAGSSIDSAGRLGDKFAFLHSLDSLRTYFVIQGVLSLLGIVIALSLMCITFILPLLGVTLIPWQDVVKDLPFTY
jgi:hypothetical protein